MDLERYRSYVTVVEEGNILRASKKLFIAQPTLSLEMKELEKLYGATLFQRGKNSF